MFRIKFLCAIAGLLSPFAFLCCSGEEGPSVVITSIEPLSGDYDDEITIRGKGFGTRAYVGFNGEDRTATVVSQTDEELVVKVTVGATNGTIRVSNSAGEAVSKDVFTVTSGSWTKRASFNYYASSTTSNFFVIGNKAYVYHLNTFSMYNPITDSWSDQTELPFEISEGGSGSTIMWGTSDKGYVLYFDELWEFNPLTSAWTQKNAPPPAISGIKVQHIFYLKEADRCYAIVNGNALYVYDQSNDTWGYKSPFTLTGTAGSTVKAVGGLSKGYFMWGKKLWSIDPEFSFWTALEDCPAEVYSDYAFGIDNDFYVGDSGGNILWVYKSATNTWVRKSGIVVPYRYWPVYFTLNNQGYMGLGVRTDNDIILQDMFVYNP